MGTDYGSALVGGVHKVRGRERRARAREGFTFAELALAMTVLMVALMSISATTLRSHSLRRQNRERVLAQNAIRSASERVHARSLAASAEPESWAASVLATFGAGGTIGDTFDVQSLTPIAADARVGAILVITDETVSDDELGVVLGMPRDLNGDGDAEDTDVSGDGRMLPVVVSAAWLGSRGEQRLVHPFYILGY